MQKLGERKKERERKKREVKENKFSLKANEKKSSIQYGNMRTFNKITYGA